MDGPGDWERYNLLGSYCKNPGVLELGDGNKRVRSGQLLGLFWR